MRKTIAMVLAILVLVSLTACGSREASSNTMIQTPVIEAPVTETFATEQVTFLASMTKMTVEEEVEKFWKQREVLKDEAMVLFEGIQSSTSVTEDIQKQLYTINKQLAELRITTVRTASDEAYAELKWYIEVYQNAWCDWQYYSDSDYFWYPLQSGYGTEFVLRANYFRRVIWSDNVKIDENNDDFGVNRTYTVIDTSRDGFVIVESVETPLQLFQIHPNN